MKTVKLPPPGLYAITPDTPDTPELIRRTFALLDCPHRPRLLQYRNKTLSPAERRKQAKAIRALCTLNGVPFIVNDTLALALELEADGLHLGQQDGDPAAARAALGPDRILGVTCHDSLELAAAAVEVGADYLAFGAFYPSASKPDAVPAQLATLQIARERYPCQRIAAIGGITAENAAPLRRAGADWFAVITDWYHASDIPTRAATYAKL